MCGLAGLFLPLGVSPVMADLDGMLSVMAHRGPDGEGRHVTPDHRFQAGFRRLAIIDLATGQQPLVARGRVLMGNGEIYNYRDLRERFSAYSYATDGDMEAALAAYDVLGSAFVHELNGMYGIALYDQGRLLLLRDRLGIKPLYWSRLSNGGILFASEPKALFASGLLSPEVDESSVTAYLTQGYVPAPATLYKGVYKLPPAYLMMVEPDGSIRFERYWRAMPRMAPENPQEELLALLEDSVRLQLRSDVPVGALLSGGIDSGLLVALAARQSERQLKTYTVRFTGAAYDESPLAAKVAERYATHHTRIDVADGDVAKALPRLAWHCDEPLADPSLLPNQMIEDVLGKEIRVALNGTGGDELFAGYGRYFQLPVERHYLTLPAFMRKGLIEPLTKALDPHLAFRLGRADLFSSDPGRYLWAHSTLFPSHFLKLIGHRKRAPSPVQSTFAAEWDGETQASLLWADINSYLPEDLLLLLDRTSMAAGVEGRVPFLDHRLVEMALSVPQATRTPEGRQKGLERAMAEELLPREVIDAPKQGFASPVPKWMAGPLGGLALKFLKRPQSLERGWWTASGVERLCAEPARHAFRIYQLVMLELVVRLHVESPSRDVPDFGLEEMLS
ncbi:MAG: asparagine synthase (glutamine-hydrolyzing) [Alphaproteobacteria bacterium]|nr:asparagine synthase (glutamine-hydrolyzing) [Alphaproteobacteria bacterium]